MDQISRENELRAKEEEKTKRLNLTNEQINQLPTKEKRQYQTKFMLTEILNSHNVKRLTTSPWAALENASQVQSFMKVGYTSEKRKMVELQNQVSDVVSRGILSKFQQESEEKLGSVFDMTEAKILGSPDKIEDEEVENELELEKLNSEPGSPLKILAKKPKDDEFKIIYDGEKADPHEIIEDGFVDIARVSVGTSFGELALIDGKPRMATIKCLTRCHFLVLNRNDYIKSLKD